jgi:hypothetical protein
MNASGKPSKRGQIIAARCTSPAAWLNMYMIGVVGPITQAQSLTIHTYCMSNTRDAGIDILEGRQELGHHKTLLAHEQ